MSKRMMSYVSLTLLVIFSVISCGGSSDRAGFLELPDLGLTNLRVEGGELLLAGQSVDDDGFNPDATGPYTVDVDEGQTSVNLITEFVATEKTVTEIIRFFRVRNDDGNFVDSELTQVGSGELFTWMLDEGENTLVVRVRDTETNATVTYNLEARLIGSEALIQSFQALSGTSGLAIGQFENTAAFIGSNDLLGFVTNGGEFPDEFIPDNELDAGQAPIRDYNFAADFDLCAISFRFAIEGEFATATLNGEDYENLTLASFPLVIGENAFQIVVNSELLNPETGESANSSTYNFTVTREEGVFNERALVNQLSLLEFFESESDLNSTDISDQDNPSNIQRSGILSPEFRCDVGVFTYEVSTESIEENFLAISATTPGAFQVELARVLLDGNGEQAFRGDPSFVGGQRRLILEDLIPVLSPAASSPEIFDGFTFDDPENDFNINVGSNLFVINAVPLPGNASLSRQTLINIVRPETNNLRVSNVEGLVEALDIAMPGDEIILSEGRYAISDIPSDARVQPFFLADQSGLAAQPITLRADFGADVVLEGLGIEEDSIFRLEADYWEIQGIEFSNGANGLTINNGSNNIVSGVRITDVAEDALIIENGSNNNKVIAAQIFSLSPNFVPPARAIVVGGEGEDVNDTFIWNSSFIDNPGSLIVLANNSNRTSVQYNSMVSDVVTSQPLLQVNGVDTLIGFNQFFVTNNESQIGRAIDVNSLEQSVSSDIFSNSLESEVTNIALFSVSEGNEVNASENQLINALLSTGEGLVNTPSNQDVFQVRPFNDSNLCLSFETVTNLVAEEVDTIDVLAFSECEPVETQLASSEQLGNQLWRFVKDDDLFVIIEPVNADTVRWSPSRVASLDSPITLGEVSDINDLGFIFRWRISLADSTDRLIDAGFDALPVVRIFNRDAPTSAVEFTDTFLTDREIARLSQLGAEDSFKFILVPVNP